MNVSHAGKTAEVNGNSISITEKLTGKQKSIPIKSIISVQIQKPGLFGAGYIYFQTVGGMGNNSMKTAYSFIKEENAIILNSKKKYNAALEIRDYIQKIQMSDNNTAPVSGADELGKYKKLMDDGVITKQEFDLKKKQLLGL